MTNEQIFEKLFTGGNFALPYLIKFSHETAGTIRLVNNNEPIEYNGEIFADSSFDYNPPDNTGAGASLNIQVSPDNDELFDFFNNADADYRLDIVGVLAEDNEVQPLRIYSHFHGNISIDETGVAEFSLEGDDRLDMTFPPYQFDTETNPGNA